MYFKLTFDIAYWHTLHCLHWEILDVLWKARYAWASFHLGHVFNTKTIISDMDIFKSYRSDGHETTVYPKKYAHGFCFAVLCCGYTLTDFPISIRLTSLALWQSNDCPSASKATLMNMDKYLMWIHYERLHNHNKAKHNKTVCIFLGIYCTVLWKFLCWYNYIGKFYIYDGYSFSSQITSLYWNRPLVLWNEIVNISMLS